LDVHLQIARTYLACVRAFERYTGTAVIRWRVLNLLHKAGQQTQKQICHSTELDGWTVTRTVKALEEEGYVTRRADPRDNRLTQVQLTAKGQALYLAIEGRRGDFMAHALQGLSQKEQHLLDDLLVRIESNIPD
jgi:DNA-binding MarR family transcriptional regulator